MSDDGLKAALTEALGDLLFAHGCVTDLDDVLGFSGIWPLVEAEMARQRQQGREDAALLIEGCMTPPKTMWQKLQRANGGFMDRDSWLTYAAQVARAVPVSEGVRAVYRNLNGPTLEDS